MAAPKRAIALTDMVLIEFDKRIKKREQEVDDLQLIDGAIVFTGLRMLVVVTFGAIDMYTTLLRMQSRP